MYHRDTADPERSELERHDLGELCARFRETYHPDQETRATFLHDDWDSRCVPCTGLHEPRKRVGDHFAADIVHIRLQQIYRVLR